MIVGPDFVWLHFPKCAGTSLELALQDLLGGRPGVHFDLVDDRSSIWHHSIKQRRKHDPAFDVGGKKVAANIRRLPSWILSRVQFEAHRSGHTATREMIVNGRFFEPDGRENAADTYMSLYAPDVTTWLRVESLAADVSRAFDLDEQKVSSALSRRKERATFYVKDVDFWFTADDLMRLYIANPKWAEVEKKVYGETLLG